jgi:hypothetical protein
MDHFNVSLGERNVRGKTGIAFEIDRGIVPSD